MDRSVAPWTARPCRGAAVCQQQRREVKAQAVATAPPPQVQKLKTPKSLGYCIPGKYEKHAGCWMGWLDKPYLWRENAKPVQEQYTAVAKAISQFEPLTMLANPELADEARAAFADAPNVTVVEVPINDGWARDWGPSCTAITDAKTGNRKVAGVHWDFQLVWRRAQEGHGHCPPGAELGQGHCGRAHCAAEGRSAGV
ncbi:hypothetical protein WJX81_008523 [Elliptochloris bilobata]|uniref:Agmatine deiminase n=1 Tax=Elliptochloris bilobata TaxID=381761 RepID=A0AAW1S147_9CHLO